MINDKKKATKHLRYNNSNSVIKIKPCVLTRQPSLHIWTEQNPLGHGGWIWMSGVVGSGRRRGSSYG